MKHETTPVNRHGERVNDDYLSASCTFGMDDDECLSNACCCSCHAITDDTWTEEGITCPSCKSLNVLGIGWGSRLIAIDEAADYENWQCKDCGKEWER
jgi:hypothetical protein